MKYEEVRVVADVPLPASVARRAAEAIRSGRVLVHPTSTLYGLGSRATREADAVLTRLKGRTEGKPFVRLAASAAAARAAASPGAWEERAELLSRRFWPGPLTLVVEDGSPEGLAVRVDSHPVVLAVLTELGELMSSTSVNRAGEPPARGPADVRSALERMPDQGGIAIFLQAGPIAGGGPSTVLSLRERPPRLVRAGRVPVAEIESCLGEEVAR